jgi:hypothetical protein
MKDWEQRLDEFLRFNERSVLTHAGGASRAEADVFAQQEYEQFAERRRAFKEEQGEQDSIKALEDAAENLSARTEDESDSGGMRP